MFLFLVHADSAQRIHYNPSLKQCTHCIKTLLEDIKSLLAIALAMQLVQVQVIVCRFSKQQTFVQKAPMT